MQTVGMMSRMSWHVTPRSSFPLSLLLTLPPDRIEPIGPSWPSKSFSAEDFVFLFMVTVVLVVLVVPSLRSNLLHNWVDVAVVVVVLELLEVLHSITSGTSGTSGTPH